MWILHSTFFIFFLNGLHNYLFLSIFATPNEINMRTRKEYIDLIREHSQELHSTFGVSSLKIFGSVSRDEHNENSDVDVFVEMPAEAILMVRLKRFLENLFQNSVDLVRMHKHINPYLLQQIETDGITVF